MMRKVWIVQVLVSCLLMLAMVACAGKEPQEPTEPATSVVPTATDTTVPATPTTEPTIEKPTATLTATPQPTEATSPTATPIPTPRPLAEGECIAWYETPAFLDQEVCVEGKVNFVRSANPARTLFFLVLDPSVPDIDHCCGLFYGWLYAKKLYDPMPEGGLSALFEDKCVRLHGKVEKAEGQGQRKMPIKAPEQLEIIECSECQIPDACGF
jgi:hypothetical protein